MWDEIVKKSSFFWTTSHLAAYNKEKKKSLSGEGALQR
jgi:hypothetical protein